MDRKLFSQVLKEKPNNFKKDVLDEENTLNEIKKIDAKKIDAKKIDAKKIEIVDINDLKCYFIKEKELLKINGCKDLYKKLFNDPVKMIFYWCEEEWQGNLFVIYKFKDLYIYCRGSYGSCEKCDILPNLDSVFNDINITDSIDGINIHGLYTQFTHPDLITAFVKFKLKERQKIEKYIIEKPVEKDIIEKSVEKDIIEKPVEKDVNIKFKTWADIVKN